MIRTHLNLFGWTRIPRTVCRRWCYRNCWHILNDRKVLYCFILRVLTPFSKTKWMTGLSKVKRVLENICSLNQHYNFIIVFILGLHVLSLSREWLLFSLHDFSCLWWLVLTFCWKDVELIQCVCDWVTWCSSWRNSEKKTRTISLFGLSKWLSSNLLFLTLFIKRDCVCIISQHSNAWTSFDCWTVNNVVYLPAILCLL